MNENLHPGLKLAKIIKEKNVTISGFAVSANIYPGILIDICKGKRDINVETAKKLETNGIGTAKMWLSMQVDYELSNKE
jgi:addiction module HigA family antidote